MKPLLLLLALVPVLAFPSGTTATASDPPRNGLIAVFTLEGITLVDPADGSARRLPGTDEMEDPAWSPDGKSLAVTGWSEESLEVYTMKADGSDPQLLLRDAWSPAWSPDGKRLVVVRGTCPDPYACPLDDGVMTVLATVRADGTDVRDLVLDEASAGGPVSEPKWSPDGRSIAFVDDAGHLKLVSADGEPGTVKQVATEALSVAWSPDGSTLAFDRYVAYGKSIRPVVIVLDLATGKETVLSGPQGGAQAPVWSPDGTQLAFLSTKPSPVMMGCGGGHVDTQLWVMAPDGTKARQAAKGFFFNTATWARSLEPAPTVRSKPAAERPGRR